MTEQPSDSEEQHVGSLSVTTPVAQGILVKKRKRQRKRHTTHSSNYNIVDEELPTTKPKTDPLSLTACRRVIFDEDGNIESTISMASEDKNISSRKTHKRAGFFDMKKLVAATNDTFLKPKSAISESSLFTGRSEILILPQTPEVEVRCVRDQHLETRIYTFPTDYDSIVKYWYLNFDQLARLNQAPDEFITQDPSSGYMNDDTKVSSMNDVPDDVLLPSQETDSHKDLTPCPTEGSPLSTLD